MSIPGEHNCKLKNAQMQIPLYLFKILQNPVSITAFCHSTILYPNLNFFDNNIELSFFY